MAKLPEEVKKHIYKEIRKEEEHQKRVALEKELDALERALEKK